MRLVRKYIIGILAILLSGDVAAQIGCTLSLGATPLGTSCSNLCDGSVTLTPSGGVGPYTLNAFDHSFPGSQVDASLFTISNGIYQVSGNILTAVPDVNSNTAYNNFISTKQAFAAGGKLIAEASFYVDNNTYGYWGLGTNAILTSQFQMPVAFFFSNGSLYTSNNGSTKIVGGYSSNTWYDFKIEKIGATVNYYFRQTGITTYTLISSQLTTSLALNYKLAATYRNVNNTYGGFKSMNWKIGGNPPTTNLCAGTYTYTVYDALGCYTSATVTVGAGTGPSSVNLNGTVTPASCAVAADGGISLIPTGGVAPYSFGLSQNFGGTSINTSIFEIRNGNFSQNSSLREGVNSNGGTGWDNSIATRQTFSDGGYLKFEGSFTFDPNTEAAFGFTDNSAVNNLSSIVIGFWISGGSRLYTIGGPNGVKSIGSIIPNTSYDFKIEKIGSKLYFYTRLTGSATYDLVNSSIVNSSIIEYRFGAVNFANSSAALGGYTTKDWSVIVTPKIARLTPGTYTYTITDASGCTATSVFSVGEVSNPITLNATLVSSSASGGATGAVSLTPGGGKAPYKYQLEENFDDSLIHAGLFTVRNGAFEETSDLRSDNIANNPSFDNGIFTNLAFVDGGRLSFAGSFKFDAGVNTIFGFSTNSAVINDPAQMVVAFGVNGTQLSGKSGRNNTQVIGTITPGVWYDLMVSKADGLVKFFIRNTGNAGNYTLLYSMPYADTLSTFKAALLVYGPNAGLNTKNWVLNSNPSLSGLAPGNYSYTVYDSKNCYGTTTINVPAVNRILTVTNQPSNSSAWNVCDGAVSFSSPESNSLTLYNIAYNQAFSGSQMPAGEFIVRNGGYSVNGNLASSNIRNNSNWDNSIATTIDVPDNGYVSAEMDMNFKANAEVYFGLASSNQALNNYTAMPYAFYYASGKLYAYTAENGSVLIGAVVANTWVSFKIEKVGSTVNFLMRPQQDINYQQIYSTTTNRSVTTYKAGIVNYFDNQGNPNRAFNSRNWYLLNDGSLNNICLGKYTYMVSAPGMHSVVSPFTVNTNFSLVQTMSAPQDITVSTDAGVAYATGVSLGNPSFNGNAANLLISHNAPAQFNLGINNVTWTAKDPWGNTNTGIQKVKVVDTEKPKITAPADLSITLTAGQTLATGVNLGTPVVSDNVPGVTSANNAASAFPIGTTTVTWTATDAAGNSSSATQAVTIIASLLPVVTAPADVTTSTNPGKAYASGVNLGSPGLSVVFPGLVISNNAPSQFPLGTTKVTWMVNDGIGHTTTAEQNVTVKDLEPPTITAPAAVVANNTTGQAYATGVVLGTPVYADNAPGVTAANNAPSQFPIGTTTITWTATDAAGNTTTTTQTVTVRDNENPSITVPNNITVSTNTGVAYASGVNLGSPSVSDNAPGVVVITNNAPSQFPMGTTSVTWTARDASGNITTAIQTVTVVDTEKPRITAPANITVMANSAGQYAINVNLGTPVYSDNVPGVTASNNAPLQFPVGINTVTWTAVDAAGNTATATQTVTVTNCSGYAVTIKSVPVNNTNTGGNPNNLYLGYGAQSTRLEVTVPNTGGPYTFLWTGAGLSSSTSATPTFAPTAAGVYTFYVSVKNGNGCLGNAAISICVKDARVLSANGSWDGKKVYVCHLPPGNPSNAQVLSVGVSAVSAHVGNHSGDGLGDCSQTCNAGAARGVVSAVAEVEVFSAKAYPNPSDNYFTLMVKSDDKYTRITVRIVDAFGRTVQRFDNVAAGKTLQFGEKFTNGAYYAEVIQGEERKMIPLIKAK